MTKTRYSVPPLGVDEFTGALSGLVMGEIEFETADEEARFPSPAESALEVTLDERFTGGRLAVMDRPELLALLAAMDLEPLDASELTVRAPRERPAGALSALRTSQSACMKSRARTGSERTGARYFHVSDFERWRPGGTTDRDEA